MEKPLTLQNGSGHILIPSSVPSVHIMRAIPREKDKDGEGRATFTEEHLFSSDETAHVRDRCVLVGFPKRVGTVTSIWQQP